MGVLESSVNFTYIAHIPKIKIPSTPSDFRYINLCNMMYKLTSKVLANRLKKCCLPLFLATKVYSFLEDS